MNKLRDYLGGKVCLCGGANFKCFEFENIVIILECKDCGRYETISKNKDIEVWYGGGIVYFCEYRNRYPLFVKKNDDIVQINGCSFFSKNKLAKKIVYDMPKRFIQKQYKKMLREKLKESVLLCKQINKLKKLEV